MSQLQGDISRTAKISECTFIDRARPACKLLPHWYTTRLELPGDVLMLKLILHLIGKRVVIPARMLVKSLLCGVYSKIFISATCATYPQR